MVVSCSIAVFDEEFETREMEGETFAAAGRFDGMAADTCFI